MISIPGFLNLALTDVDSRDAVKVIRENERALSGATA